MLAPLALDLLRISHVDNYLGCLFSKFLLDRIFVFCMRFSRYILDNSFIVFPTIPPPSAQEAKLLSLTDIP